MADKITFADRIIYSLNTIPGGVDGRDPSDKGGIVYASFYKVDVVSKQTAWHKIGMMAMSAEELKELYNKTLNKLSPIERLVLGLQDKGQF